MTDLIKVFLIILVLVFLVGLIFGAMLKIGMILLLGFAIWFLVSKAFGKKTY